MKHFGIVTIAIVLLLCASVFGANKIAVNNVRAEADNVIVPIELSNSIPMVALELPLRFSEGATLVDVTFEGTRSEDFDFAWAKINNEENTVVIALIPMVYGENKDLEPGEGTIANMEFSINAADMEILEIEPVVLKDPNHELMFVYDGDEQSGQEDLQPEFPAIKVELAKLIDNNLLPTEFALHQNAPNPFNPDTKIKYDLPYASSVRLDVYNVLGQKVTTLIDSYQEAGSQSVVWNGTNNQGQSVASGVYFYRIEAEGFSATKKMMMLK
jgi:hypothetical protein